MIQIFDKLQQINVLISISSTLHIHATIKFYLRWKVDLVVIKYILHHSFSIS